MKAVHLPADSTVEDVTAALRVNGYCIVDELVPGSLMDAIAAEMGPYVEASPFGIDNMLGKLTKRTGAMIARSPAARDLVMNPLAIDVAGKWLEKATTMRLHLTQIISVFPGSPAQPLHRDELAWDFFPFPLDYEIQCNILWAFTDFTIENGATHVVPGSHLIGGDQKYAREQSIQAEMKRGSALFYTGKIYHGAGENRSSEVRQAINITYAVGWVRQEENQYLSTPLEIARELPEDLLKVMGYQLGCFALGYVGDAEDPMWVLRKPEERTSFGLDHMRKTADRQGSANAFLEDIVP